MSEKKQFENIKKDVSTGRGAVKEIAYLMDQMNRSKNPNEKKMFESQIKALKSSIHQTTKTASQNLEKVNISRPLNPEPVKKPVNQIKKAIEASTKKKILKPINIPKELSKLEKETIKRLRKKKKKIKKKKNNKPSKYLNVANKLFAEISKNLLEKKKFEKLSRSLRKSKLDMVPTSYISSLFFTTIVSIIIALVIFIFFLFFNIEVTLPILTQSTDPIFQRFLKTFWVLFVIPLVAFLITYFYPSMEEKSAGNKIDQELPFATIHMSAISGSMLDPSKIFSIIIATKEYPSLEKEFIRIMNQINIYGYDLVNALKSVAYNSPSKKLAELLTGLATTISSGGNLPDFFDKRSQTLLFDYKIDREKYSKTAETMMDIYISVVIAAPMIFMLLMMMMKISGLGLSVSTNTITLMTILGVVLINIVFLSFLQIKQPSG
jgi:Flp pilus assembly protein TadB